MVCSRWYVGVSKKIRGPKVDPKKVRRAAWTDKYSGMAEAMLH